jgi:hypothetical protein
VLDNTRANEGFIITCNGFTDDAAKCVKAKGIKLVVLRIHEEKDWEGYIKTVVVRLLALTPANPTMTIHLPDQAEQQRFESAMQSLHRPRGNAPVPAIAITNKKGKSSIHEPSTMQSDFVWLHGRRLLAG